ncbi:PP2C family serine/threonine-protein phosphatase [Polyangium mundeleinium]|uniref:PP2C family serine/threonine-protein phosphatase n=1 Tax=Polyangium mundeleinium TaxID=2995306 RepID=A0ABT5EJR3_9BACT|nr:PP2C family serine/threonine-protein phosphatase [Polyangium mundeleinium]MDC0741584.1 PP2C family serine/threonine-protein phosphatase [Polyangium mundeleinium]
MREDATVAAWRVTRVSVAGTSHIARGVPCQDASYHDVNGDLCVIAVADGVGSAPRSEDGARVASEMAVRFLIEKAVARDASEAEWRALLQEAAERALLEVRALAERETEELRAFASTLLIVAATGESAAAFQVGDGAIVALFGTADLQALTLPKKGEYANEVLPLTSRGALESAQFTFVPQSPTAVAAFTDGLEALALSLPRGEPYDRFFLPIFDLGARVDETKLAAEIGELFEQRVKKRSDDDLTLAVAIRAAGKTVEPIPAKPESAPGTAASRAREIASARGESDPSPPAEPPPPATPPPATPPAHRGPNPPTSRLRSVVLGMFLLLLVGSAASVLLAKTWFRSAEGIACARSSDCEEPLHCIGGFCRFERKR